MLPGDIQAYIAQHPEYAAGYQNFLSWIAAGAKHPSWTSQAEAAAAALGISRYKPGYAEGTWTHRDTPWGEGQEINPATGQPDSVYNQAWMDFVTNFTAQQGQPTTQQYAEGDPNGYWGSNTTRFETGAPPPANQPRFDKPEFMPSGFFDDTPVPPSDGPPTTSGNNNQMRLRNAGKAFLNTSNFDFQGLSRLGKTLSAGYDFDNLVDQSRWGTTPWGDESALQAWKKVGRGFTGALKQRPRGPVTFG